jgi:SNARE protein
MDEIEDYDRQLIGLITEIEAGILEIPKLKGALKSERFGVIKERTERAKQVLYSMKIELRDLRDTEKVTWEAKFKDHSAKMQTLVTEQGYLKAEVDREELGLGRTGDIDTANLTTAEKFKYGDKLQDESLASLQRSAQTVEITKKVGQDTAEELAAQTARLQKVDDTLAKTLEGLERAKHEARMFLRRQATDKLVLMLLFLIVLAVAGCIIFAAINPNSGLNVPDGLTNTTNVRKDIPAT